MCWGSGITFCAYASGGKWWAVGIYGALLFFWMLCLAYKVGAMTKASGRG